MCSIFIAIAGAASDMGMGAALIQNKNNEEAEKMYPTAFFGAVYFGG